MELGSNRTKFSKSRLMAALVGGLLLAGCGLVAFVHEQHETAQTWSIEELERLGDPLVPLSDPTNPTISNSGRRLLHATRDTLGPIPPGPPIPPMPEVLAEVLDEDSDGDGIPAEPDVVLPPDQDREQRGLSHYKWWLFRRLLQHFYGHIFDQHWSLKKWIRIICRKIHLIELRIARKREEIIGYEHAEQLILDMLAERFPDIDLADVNEDHPAHPWLVKLNNIRRHIEHCKKLLKWLEDLRLCLLKLKFHLLQILYNWLRNLALTTRGALRQAWTQLPSPGDFNVDSFFDIDYGDR